MRTETAAVIGPIVADLETSGYAVSIDEDWGPSPYDPHSAAREVMVRTAVGGGNGILVGAPGDPVTAEMVAEAAHALQDGIIEAGFYETGTATIWPSCPRHPATHPLTPTTRGDEVFWSCPGTGELFCRLGELGSSRA
ncbi:hypothetical protein ACFQ46_12685 [Kineococcus sp. GCM10028916]|uniref:hypothetical protein n=1 Tax=Kineococcus sp. GCM10028916 TaxID=3273394 RepID=UPI0036325360